MEGKGVTVKRVKTAKNIKFRRYTVSHAMACRRVEELGLPPLWKLALKANALPVRRLEQMI